MIFVNFGLLNAPDQRSGASTFDPLKTNNKLGVQIPLSGVTMPIKSFCMYVEERKKLVLQTFCCCILHYYGKFWSIIENTMKADNYRINQNRYFQFCPQVFFEEVLLFPPFTTSLLALFLVSILEKPTITSPPGFFNITTKSPLFNCLAFFLSHFLRFCLSFSDSNIL